MDVYVYMCTCMHVLMYACSLLVGLRWWNEVKDDGSNVWVFESRPVTLRMYMYMLVNSLLHNNIYYCRLSDCVIFHRDDICFRRQARFD